MIISKGTTYFRRNLISYFIIFFLPFLIFSLIYQLRFRTTLQEELIDNNFKQLSALKTTVDDELEQLQAIVNQTIFSQNMVPFHFNLMPLEALKRIEILDQYTSTNPFIYEMMLHYHGDPFIYSSTGSLSLDNTFGKVYSFENWPLETFIQDLESSAYKTIKVHKKLNVYTKQEAKTYTVLMYGISHDGINHYGKLLFFIPEEAITSMIDTIYAANNHYTFILGDNGDLITSKQSNGLIDHAHLQDYLNALKAPNSSVIVPINGSDYLLSSTLSPETGWQYINFTSVNAALAVAVEMQQQFFAMVILLLLVGIVIISFLMTINYSPIRKLQNTAKTIVSNKNQMDKNEFRYIEDAITFLRDKNTALVEAMDDTKIASKDYVIGQLLSGQTMKSNLMDSGVIKKVMNPHHHHYVVFIVNISQDEHIWSDMKLELIGDIESYSNEHMVLLCKESIVANSITVLCLYDDSYVHLLHERLNEVLQGLSFKWKEDVTLGLGISFTSLDDLPKSYMAASTAIDYRLMVGKGSMILYDEIVGNMKKVTNYPLADLKLFRLSIKKGNVQDIDTILNNIVSQFASNTIPIFIARTICYEIIHTVVNSYEELGQEHQDIFSKYPDIFSITKYESIDKIIEIVKLISYDVCKSLSKSYDNDNKILIANMNTYIQDNYMDANFSLQTMADHYNTLPPNLSSFYKENTHNNIFEVVTELRMTAASELLMTSQLPVNQICSKIGYDNVSSFIRRFKQYYGITPGQYRSLNVS